MAIHPRFLSSLFLAGALSSAFAGVSCAGHHSYRVYDAYYTDYHSWDRDEVRSYLQWSNQTHRDSHRDFRRLPPEEQREYWTWRHNHADHDRDHHDQDRH